MISSIYLNAIAEGRFTYTVDGDYYNLHFTGEEFLYGDSDKYALLSSLENAVTEYFKVSLKGVEIDELSADEPVVGLSFQKQ